jgi:hypothetical protein
MAKPILVVRANVPHDMIDKLAKKLSKQFYDYHVLTILDKDIINPVFETYNDCSGLSDIDIRELIKNISNNSIN